MEKGEPEIDQSFKYDERKRILTSTVKKSIEGIESTYFDVFTEQGIKDFYQRISSDCKRAQNQINQTEKLIESNEDKIKEYEKTLPELTEEEKKFIQTVKKVSMYDQVDKLEAQNEIYEENLIEIRKNLKESKIRKNEIRTKVKFKLE